MSTAHQLTTAEQLLAMPDDGHRYDLVRGELRKMTPAGFEHDLTNDGGETWNRGSIEFNMSRAE
jgi:hypothetical protein